MQRDKLETIFAMQHALDDYIEQTRHLQHFTREEWIQKKAMALMVELGEMLDETRYKWWKNPKPVDAEALKEELVDILHFYVGMCLKAGMSAEELYGRYLGKNEENYKRQLGTSEKKGYALAEGSE